MKNGRLTQLRGKNPSSNLDIYPVRIEQKNDVQITTNSLFSVAIIDPITLHIFSSKEGISMEEFRVQEPESMVSINGGYFDLLADGSYVPTGALISDGKLLYLPSTLIAQGLDPNREQFAEKANKEKEWSSVFFVLIDGTAHIASVEDFDMYHTPSEYAEINVAIECGPILIYDKEIKQSEFEKRKSANKTFSRSAIGINQEGRIILFCSKEKMTYLEVAKKMLELGAVDAMMLDGGPSSAFEVNDKENARIPNNFDGPSKMIVNTIIYSKND